MKQKTILVATDFSERSDRALRRGTLLARRMGAMLLLVHVIDDDQPERIVRAERAAAAAVLNEHVRTLPSEDGLNCDAQIIDGDPFEGITRAAEDFDADLVIIGPHRRQTLRDVFVGTTAERTVRSCRRPVLMANGVPAGHYRKALVAVDLWKCSADAVHAVRGLAAELRIPVAALHVFDAIGASLMPRGMGVGDLSRRYLDEQRESARKALDAFLSDNQCESVEGAVAYNESSIARVILENARTRAADLLVIGTRGHSGMSKLFLGSVAEETLASAAVDVLAVPPRQ
ncbi:MAG: universal stress protein [Nevskiales bacterium]|nr:universal stress protein [Nevskiales bacterium]